VKQRLVTIGVVGAVLIGVAWIRPGFASWSSDNCHGSTHLVSALKRVDARDYAGVAVHEGYEWGGGCWNNDDRDDTPGAPDSGGEGPDCSGLVFKTWELRLTYGAAGFRWYSNLMDVHGPYAASSFRDATPKLPFRDLSSKTRFATTYMDAFASPTHIGLIWSNAVPSEGGDYIVEAYDDAEGTQVNVEDYRADSAFRAVRRKAWTPDCAPRCPSGGLVPRTVVVG